jgi:hypothetical protein
MILNKGRGNGNQVLKPETVALIALFPFADQKWPGGLLRLRTRRPYRPRCVRREERRSVISRSRPGYRFPLSDTY